MPLIEAALDKAAELAFDLVLGAIKDTAAGLASSRDDMERALAFHLREVKNWCQEIKFADLQRTKSTANAYVPLTLYVTARKRRLDVTEEVPTVRLDEVLQSDQVEHVILLGQPGAGKTTSIQYMCYRLLFDDQFASSRLALPLVIRLRELPSRGTKSEFADPNSQTSIYNRLAALIGLHVDYPPSLQGEEHIDKRRSIRDRVLVEALESLGCLVLLDGFDEVVSRPHREQILADVRSLALQLEKSIVVLTSRTGDLDVSVPRMALYEISPLTDLQIKDFATKWLGEGDGKALVKSLARSPFRDTSIRPINIAHLCAIYERIGRIPDKPKTVYRKIVTLLLNDWDEQRSVQRRSMYSGFEVDRKFDFLASLSYSLTLATKGTLFSRGDLVKAYNSIHAGFSLPGSQAVTVAQEVEAHTGLFIQSGQDSFEFSHKSLQEYLAAEHIVRLPEIPTDHKSLLSLPNELAIATAISSSTSEYFTVLVRDRLANLSSKGGNQSRSNFSLFIRRFINRLLLEKPDFDRSQDVGYALLHLYSLYVESMLQTSAQLELFMLDRLAAEFEQLAGLIVDRVKAKDLLTDFEIIERNEGVGNVPVLRLRGLESNPIESAGVDVPEATRRGLPSSLWVRESLLSQRRT